MPPKSNATKANGSTANRWAIFHNGPSRGPARQAWALARVSIAHFQRSQLTRMAAALSFRTIFGLIPTLVVGLVLLTAYSTREQRRDVITQLLAYGGISQIVVEPETPSPATAPANVPQNPASSSPPNKITPPTSSDSSESPPADAANPAALNPTTPLPSAVVDPDHAGDTEVVTMEDAIQHEANAESAERLDNFITDLLDRVGSIQFGAIGIIGMLTVIYAAISMMVEIEQAFNHLCNAPQGRSWARRITLYWTLLTLGSVFIIASFAAGESIRSFTANLAQTEAFSFMRGTLLGLLGFAITCAISTILLLIAYTTVPNTRVHIGPALIGAVIAAVMWESGKWGFTTYVHYSAGYSRLYGSLALIPLFLLWVYLTWLIVLFGLQLAYATQSFRTAQREGLTQSLLVTLGVIEDPRPIRSGRLVDPAIVLGLLAKVAERFAKGQRTEPSSVSADLGLDDASTSELLERLTAANLVLRVGDDASFTLARPPESIDAADVMTQAHHWGAGDAKHAPAFLADLARQRVDALRGATLASLMATQPAQTPAQTPNQTAASNQSARPSPHADLNAPKTNGASA